MIFEDAVRAASNTLASKSARFVSALEASMRGHTAIPSPIVCDPAVGLYIDGVYVANGQAAMGTMLDIDSVEIVRGAQGTRFGRNNTGGSIDFSTQRTLRATNPTDKRYAYDGGKIVNPSGPPIASWQAAADRRLYGVEGTYQLCGVR